MTKARQRTFQVSHHERMMRHEAVDPARSVFVSANAGSGKTTILTDRVIRLLLAGAEPSRILCLTYTKAAAAEMQDRVFKTLADWVRETDEALGARIMKLTNQRPSRDDISRARTLFALAVETPGGLKIQTIHAFAERLLHLFPFEANVPARFQVMDEPAKAELFAHARRATFAAALGQGDEPLGQAFHLLADVITEDDFTGLMAAALPLLRKSPASRSTDQWRRPMAAVLDIDPDLTEERAAHELIEAVFPRREWDDALADVQGLGEKNLKRDDLHFIKQLGACIDARSDVARATALIDLFVKSQDGAVRQTMLNKGAATKLPDLIERLADGSAVLDEHRARLRLVRLLDRSVALMLLTGDCLTRYRRDKTERALVDFDDMIDKALELVTRADGASWVLLKLDGGIDHVLIDEAQDTTPQMWSIVRALTAEFFAGEGARQSRRTIFAVGDEKQSIYSFQGAQPAEFAESRRHFTKAVQDADLAFQHHELKLSFRTVTDVLQAVDAVFSAPARFAGLSSDQVATAHETARGSEPGVVELWSLEPPTTKDDRDAWEEVDAPGRNSAKVRLAERIASHIQSAIQFDTFEDDGAKVGPGDIMVLVQRRDDFFDAIIRALKRMNVPVAGADRVKLTEEIAVRDLIAAAKVALLPEDDLTLAEVLKSPLIGLTDLDLINIAPGRPGSLYAALANHPAYRNAHMEIEQWRTLAVTVPPYEFFATLLGPREGRRKLLERLGPDAADGIELFLANVLARESREPPSLTAEIAAFSTLTTDIKRDQEQAGEAVRVLTVHGAKGLEARIVYLPDSNRTPVKKDAALYPFDAAGDDPIDRVLLWAPIRKERPAAIVARDLANDRAQMDEYRRLFYVAMTRAKDRLIIAGWGTLEKMKPGAEPKEISAEKCWYKMAADAFDEKPEHVEDSVSNGVAVRRWRVSPPEKPRSIAPTLPLGPGDASLPTWLRQPVAEEAIALPPLRPSRALDAADQRVAPERDLARQRGDLVHLLLERLPEVPEQQRVAGARTLLAERAGHLPQADRDRIASGVLGLMVAPENAALFGTGSRGEVAIAGDVALPNGETRSILGRIDRLAVLDETIILADFKTGRGPSRARAVTQMALYRALLSAIYPGRSIEARLIWTDRGRVERLTAAEMDAALAAL